MGEAGEGRLPFAPHSAGYRELQAIPYSLFPIPYSLFPAVPYARQAHVLQASVSG
jgi:hypothetical protein